MSNVFVVQVCNDSGFRRESRARRPRTRRYSECEDLPGRHHLPLVRQIYGLSGGAAPEEEGRIQEYRSIPVPTQGSSAGSFIQKSMEKTVRRHQRLQTLYKNQFS